jgi:hypothetical protein
VHDHGDERADDRTSDIELFFKRYETMTGGSGQNGVLHGLEVPRGLLPSPNWRWPSPSLVPGPAGGVLWV